MKLSEIKKALDKISEIKFQLPNGDFVPSHFHITEVGAITKHFIDCGGKERKESVVNFQLWEAEDFDHRLAPQKLKNIIDLAENRLNLTDNEVEVEYQMDTIGKFGLHFNGRHFVLTPKKTDCLAKDKCGIPVEKQRIKLSSLKKNTNKCQPNSNCC